MLRAAGKMIEIIYKVFCSFSGARSCSEGQGTDLAAAAQKELSGGKTEPMTLAKLRILVWHLYNTCSATRHMPYRPTYGKR